MPNIEELDKLMADDVYANGNAISCKAGGGKVIAAFPDVCLSPPSPPAGPIPVPYPDTSFSKDMKKGSKTVNIGNKEVMLKDKSFYKTSPLGNEAATKSLGANVVTHVITGKTYFGAWSMDVKIEGMNVPRHVDLTTSNHASYPGGSGPMTNMETLAVKRIEKDLCACCGKARHATGKPMSRDAWHNDAMDKEAGNPPGMSKNELREKKKRYKALIKDAKARKGCSCTTKTDVLPKAPCDVFYGRQPDHSDQRTEQMNNINNDWNAHRPRILAENRVGSGADTRRKLTRELGRAPNGTEFRNARKTNHLTPKTAGGCPTGKGNLQFHPKLCPSCQELDGRFNEFQY